MADQSAIKINGEVNRSLSSDFADKVQRDYVKSENPDEVVTCKDLPDVLIYPDASLCCRLTSRYIVFTWNFRILTNGKQLERVVLTLDNHRKNFVLKSISKGIHDVLLNNSQEWCKSTTGIEAAAQNSNERQEYMVKISFIGNGYGTYRQNVLFYFGKYPVVLKRICVDCVPDKDLLRLRDATDYQLAQYAKMWIDERMQICRFKSPFVPPKDPKEEKLSMIYPYPNRTNFMLTQETLTEDRLTPENYKGRLHELIAVEELARHEQISRYNEISHMRLVSNYILTSTGDASTVAKYATPGELFAQLPLCRTISEDTKSGRLFLRGCNSVLFKTLNNLHKDMVFEAHIEDKCTQCVYVRLSKECVDELNLTAGVHMEVQVQFVLNRLPFCEWHRAVDSLSDVELVFLSKSHQEIKDPSILDLLSVDGLTFSQNWNWLVLNPLLNMEQKRALAIMTAPTRVSLPPILLLGPFGTGKTFTIAQALRILLIENPDNKILLCTHSNSAADLYVKEFFDVLYRGGNCPRLKPVRIYYKGRASNTVHKVVQEYSLMKSNGTFRDPTDEDLRDCGLIVTTLATSSCLTCLNLSLTHIVIDEAAQALECEILIPLALATRNTRLILAGDQMQLAPEIYSDLANECGLGMSLLERIYETYPENHPCRIHLCQNYRAHADIIKFTSEVFYDGIVKPGKNLLTKHPILKPLTFYAVQGEETQGVHSTGYTNASEAVELANRVMDLKNAWPTDRWGAYDVGSIGVLACYAEQVQRIRTELRKRKLHDVSVERVLNVQGKQFTAVFISTVRTKFCCKYSSERNVNDYGFLTNPRLLNTAITRAKCLVAVVGDPVALLTIGSCRKLWQKYLEVAHLHGINRETLNIDVRSVPELPATPLNPLAQEFVPRNRQPSCFVEYVPLPIMYPIIQYSQNHWPLR